MKLLANRTAQYPLFQEFAFSWNNWVVDTVDGAKKTFGSTPALSTDPNESGLTGAIGSTVTFDALPMPPGAVVIGGELIVETAFVGPTACTVSVGIAGSLVADLAATSLLSAGRTALLLTSPLLESAGQNVRLTFTFTVAQATAGKARIRVMYTVDGRSNEVQVS
jgi:hypothetical protein